GTDKDQIKEVLGKLSPLEKETVKSEYARKYHSDLPADLLEELGGRDRDDAMRAVKRDATSAREAFNDAREEAYRSRDGFGKAWVDGVWDGTGYQTDRELNAFAQAMAEYSRQFQEMPVEQRKELAEKLNKALDLYKQSEEGAADATVDGLILAGGLGGAAFTAGASLTLVR